MTDQAAKDAASKTRVLNHMNKDHQEEMSHYLRHYASLTPSQAEKPELLDMTFTHMTLTTAWGASCTPPSAYRIPIEPPMQSWADARLRAVDMNTKAMNGLGISNTVVDAYVTPTPFHAVVMGLCAFTFLSMSAQALGYIKPRSVPYDLLEKYFPGGASRYIWIQKLIGLPTLVVHTGEALWMDRQLVKYNVKRGSGLWYKWVVSSFIEGFGALVRVNHLVKKKEGAESKNH